MARAYVVCAPQVKALCQKNTAKPGSNKKFNAYARLESAKAYWERLAAETGFPVSALVVSIKGDNNKDSQETWVNPEIAIDVYLPQTIFQQTLLLIYL